MRRGEPILRIRLLGPLEVEVGGRPIVVDTRKALAIIALVSAEGRPFARDELAAMFWPDADDEAARGALRRTLSALRTAVGDQGLTIDRARVTLDPKTCWVDLLELERLAASDRASDLEAAVTLARGPFLAGFALRGSPAFDDWQAARSSRVERMAGDVLDRLAEARSLAGDAAGAIEAARRRVELDPLDEPGQRRVMALLARSGDRSGAIRQYRALVALFDRELGVAPLRETTDLYEAIREDRAEPPTDLVAESASAVALDADIAVTAPEPRPVLVGRDDDLAAILRAACGGDPDGRVVVVEGEAGIGKTRLVESVVDVLRSSGGTVLGARGYPGEAGIPYGPIAELLRAGLATPDGVDRLAVLDETARNEIGRLIDLPAELPSGASRRSAPPSRSARVRLLDAIASALTVLVAGPVVGAVWIDDLHLADDSTREFVAYLARRLDGRPLVLIGLAARGLVGRGGGDRGRLPSGCPVRSISSWSGSSGPPSWRSSAPRGRGPSRTTPISMLSWPTPRDCRSTSRSSSRAVRTPGTSIPRGVQALLRERSRRWARRLPRSCRRRRSSAVHSRPAPPATPVAGPRKRRSTPLSDSLGAASSARSKGPAGEPVRFDFSHGILRDAAYDGISLGATAPAPPSNRRRAPARTDGRRPG